MRSILSLMTWPHPRLRRRDDKHPVCWAITQGLKDSAKAAEFVKIIDNFAYHFPAVLTHHW